MLSLWDFFAPIFRMLYDHRTPDRLEKIEHTSPQWAGRFGTLFMGLRQTVQEE